MSVPSGIADRDVFLAALRDASADALCLLYAEAYDLSRAHDDDHLALARRFAEWQNSDLDGYLLRASIAILSAVDGDSPLLDRIQDRATELGEGRLAAFEALRLGVAAPTLFDAVHFRALSAIKEQRIVAERLTDVKTLGAKVPSLADALGDALLAASVSVYAQCFALAHAANAEHSWELNLEKVCDVWQQGRLQSELLRQISDAYQRNTKLYNLFFDPYCQLTMTRCQLALRRVVATAAAAGIPVAALSSALSHFDAFRRARSPANLVQAQHDYASGCGFQRVDQQGIFRHEWGSGD